MRFGSDSPRWTVSDEHDEMIERFAARLRPLPEIDPEARARVLVAVAAERQRDRERQLSRRYGLRVARWTAAAAMAAAVVFSVLLLERGTEAPVGTTSVATPVTAPAIAGTPATASASLAAHDAAAAPSQQVELVFRAPDARHVSVVGDFTGWDPSRAVMTRDSGSGLWSVTLTLTPGRHVYAFLVDDSVWVRDPRAPSAPDADFGRPGSVLLVGRP
jgi:hypothetical protein